MAIGFGKSKEDDVVSLIAAKKYARAIEVLKAQLQKKGANPSLRMQLADVLILADKKQEAVALLIPLADQYARDGFAAKAVSVLKKIQKVDPGRRDVEERLARQIEERQREAASLPCRGRADRARGASARSRLRRRPGARDRLRDDGADLGPGRRAGAARASDGGGRARRPTPRRRSRRAAAGAAARRRAPLPPSGSPRSRSTPDADSRRAEPAWPSPPRRRSRTTTSSTSPRRATRTRRSTSRSRPSSWRSRARRPRSRCRRASSPTSSWASSTASSRSSRPRPSPGRGRAAPRRTSRAAARSS